MLGSLLGMYTGVVVVVAPEFVKRKGGGNISLQERLDASQGCL
jgi:hypothetical protein